MKKAFIYWDNSNIYIGAKRASTQLDPNEDGAFIRVRINLKHLYYLARNRLDVERIVVATSSPPELTELANLFLSLSGSGKGEVLDFTRGEEDPTEQEVPDTRLQLRMLEAMCDCEPGVVVVLTGDGSGYEQGTGFWRTLERMHKNGWEVELLSWKEQCHSGLRKWLELNGKFVPLDDHYKSITYLKEPLPDQDLQGGYRGSENVDLSKR